MSNHFQFWPKKGKEDTFIVAICFWHLDHAHTLWQRNTQDRAPHPTYKTQSIRITSKKLIWQYSLQWLSSKILISYVLAKLRLDQPTWFLYLPNPLFNHATMYKVYRGESKESSWAIKCQTFKYLVLQIQSFHCLYLITDMRKMGFSIHVFYIFSQSYNTFQISFTSCRSECLENSLTITSCIPKPLFSIMHQSFKPVTFSLTC